MDTVKGELRRAKDRLRFSELSICNSQFSIFILQSSSSHGFHRRHQLNNGGLSIGCIQPQHGSFRHGCLIIQGTFKSPQLLDREQFLARAAAAADACQQSFQRRPQQHGQPRADGRRLQLGPAGQVGRLMLIAEPDASQRPATARTKSRLRSADLAGSTRVGLSPTDGPAHSGILVRFARHDQTDCGRRLQAGRGRIARPAGGHRFFRRFPRPGGFCPRRWGQRWPGTTGFGLGAPESCAMVRPVPACSISAATSAADSRTNRRQAMRGWGITRSA